MDLAAMKTCRSFFVDCCCCFTWLGTFHPFLIQLLPFPELWLGLPSWAYTLFVLLAQVITEWIKTFHFSFSLPSRIWESIFYSRALFTLLFSPTISSQPAFIKVFPGAGSSTLKSAGVSWCGSNTTPTQPFLWITQQSTKMVLVGNFWPRVSHRTGY